MSTRPALLQRMPQQGPAQTFAPMFRRNVHLLDMEISPKNTSHQVTRQRVLVGNHPQHSLLPRLLKQLQVGWGGSKYRRSRMPTQPLIGLCFDQRQQREFIAPCQPWLRIF